MTEQKLKEYLSLTNALLDSMRASVDRNSNGMWKFISYRTYMAKYNGLGLKVAQEVQPEPLLELLDVYDMKTIPDEFNSPGALQQHLFEAVCTNLAILKSFLENRVNIRKDEITELLRIEFAFSGCDGLTDVKKKGSSDKCVFHVVGGVDLEGEEFKISISVRLALHGLDLVVGCLQGSGGNGMVIVGQ